MSDGWLQKRLAGSMLLDGVCIYICELVVFGEMGPDPRGSALFQVLKSSLIERRPVTCETHLMEISSVTCMCYILIARTACIMRAIKIVGGGEIYLY